MPTLSDVLTLAKAGYKRKEIDELLKAQNEAKPELNLQESKVSEPVQETVQENKDTAVESVEASQTTAEEVAVDYEALYNEALKIIDSEKKRADAAEAYNRRSSVGESAPQVDYKKQLYDLFSR